MDAFGHVNHANTVTLLEEARVELLFGEATRLGAGGMTRGVVVARLVVDYHAPLVANGTSVRVAMTVREMHAASFTLDYSVHGGPTEDDMVAATAQTRLVPYDTENGRPRRLTEEERDFLAAYRSNGA
ncbi:acyl-CoA thioesterase [Actinophytocola oryzae]|uniref:Acyl-CoA thioester hydrolase n=1 Tax=Actinophytocola oryzae TaxID=502181 RepID=A0A4R7UVN3_9PSEU|nr:thioesterase family protein [Actinophytocola oryzae]TDV38750.1 acyl-CoA thioester hydrolase [Actinophytocola oryzae]